MRGREGRVLKTRQLLHFVCPLLIFENAFEVQKIFYIDYIKCMATLPLHILISYYTVYQLVEHF